MQQQHYLLDFKRSQPLVQIGPSFLDIHVHSLVVLLRKVIPEAASLLLHLTAVQDLPPVLLQALQVLLELVLDVVFVLQQAALELVACDLLDLELLGFVLVEETIDVSPYFDLLGVVVFLPYRCC